MNQQFQEQNENIRRKRIQRIFRSFDNSLAGTFPQLLDEQNVTVSDIDEQNNQWEYQQNSRKRRIK